MGLYPFFRLQSRFVGMLLARSLWRVVFLKFFIFCLVSLILVLFKYLHIAISFFLLSSLLSTKLYLLLESFVSLRHAPIEVYAAVPWIQNLPLFRFELSHRGVKASVLYVCDFLY